MVGPDLSPSHIIVKPLILDPIVPSSLENGVQSRIDPIKGTGSSAQVVLDYLGSLHRRLDDSGATATIKSTT
jgi:hypothetical protein